MNSNVSNLISSVERSISSLDEINAGEHERGGREFVWNKTEIGHVHWNGDLDILFSKNVRTALIQAGITQTHKWIPQSGWTTFRIQQENDITMANNLLRLSYFYKRTRKSSTAEEKERYLSQLLTLPFPPSVFAALSIA